MPADNLNDAYLLLGELRGKIDATLKEFEHLIEKLEDRLDTKDDEMAILRDIATDAKRLAGKAEEGVAALDKSAVKHEHLGSAGLALWQWLLGALWSVALVVGAHLWK